MIISIANPMYDSVFCFLMEDERVAKTILSALLKREVVEVEVRKHEYTNGSKDKISMFRLDFIVKVREDDGSLNLLAIELIKTWLETETLRFRQYLGEQYADPENILKDDNPYGIPMVSIFLLGHRVGDIEEPVLYVRHKSFDYDGNEVTKGIPDPFVESLVHDSIIVQIPLLHGHVNNRLMEVLSVFDQSSKDKFNWHNLIVDEDNYANDTEMMHILHRLLIAASDSKLRRDMDMEYECYSVLQNRDTTIMMMDKKIAQQKEHIAQQEKALLTTAKALKDTGMPIEQIAEMTNLPLDKIKKL